MMRSVLAVFGSRGSAELARTRILRGGLPAEQAVISASLTGDALAAEAPGQSYGNQPYQPPDADPEPGQCADEVRAGECVLTVRADSEADLQRARELMQHVGGRLVASPR